MRLDSSYIRSMDYDSASHTLIVHFRDRAVVKYFSVHPRTYQAILHADSHGEKFHELIAGKRFTILKQAAILENFQPHMHLRGKAMEVEAILPDGRSQVISYVGNFNFNWMTNYIYADDAAPLLPKGTVIHVVAWHDNTKANKSNPDSDQWVGYGDRTVDEMAHAWINVTYLTDEEYKTLAEQRNAKPDTVAQQR